MTKHLLFIFFSAFSIAATAQTPFWTDDFESANSSSGTRTPENNGGVGGPPFTAYFCRTPATATVAQSIAFSGFQGSNYWAGEDHDATGTTFPGAGTGSTLVREQEILWTGINISGKTNMEFKGLFAANSNSTPFDNRNVCNGGATTNTDYIFVQYRIDGGAWSDLLRFFSKGSTVEKYLFQETTGDSCGETPQLVNIFNEFTADITGTGTTMDLRLAVYVEGNNEEWGADNFRLSEGAALPVQLTAFSGKTAAEGNMLYWSTASEQNNSHFLVQRSADGISYEDIGRVEGAGSSSGLRHYGFIDRSPLLQQYLYRLKQVSHNGDFKYSKVIVLTAEAYDFIRVYPNPVTDRCQVNVGREIQVNGIWLLDATGREVSRPHRTVEGYSYDMAELPAGMYTLKMMTGRGVITRQISKQ